MLNHVLWPLHDSGCMSEFSGLLRWLEKGTSLGHIPWRP